MMTTTVIDDPIEVLASFTAAGLRPLRFKWQGRSYTIQQINGRWLDRREEAEHHHYSVQIHNTTFFLHLACRTMQWRLDEVTVGD